MGLTPSTRRRASSPPASTSSRAATTSGTSARSTRTWTATDRVLRPHNYGTHDVPGRGFGRVRRARRLPRRGDQPPGPDLHAADREPVHRCRRAARRVVGARAAAADPPRRLPLRADVREERARAVPRRAGQRGRRDAHARRHGRRADPAGRHGLPDRPGHDGSGVERHRVRPGDRPAAVHQRAADAVRGRERAGGLQRRCRSTSIRRPVGRSRWSGSSSSSRCDRPRGRRRPTASSPIAPHDSVGRDARSCRPRLSTVDLHTHSTRRDGVLAPATLIEATSYAAGVRILALTDHDTLAGYREVVAANCRAAGPDPHPRGRDQRARDPRPRAVGGGAAHPGLRDGSGRRGVRGGAGRSERRDGCGSIGRSTCCARSGCRSMPRSRHLDLGDDDALGRPTIARALVAAGFASSVEDAFSRIIGQGRPGYVAAPGLGRRRRSRPSRMPAGSRSWPTSARRRIAREVAARARRRGAARAGGLLPDVRRRRPWRRSATSRATRAHRDRRQRLPRRPRAVRRGARRGCGCRRRSARRSWPRSGADAARRAPRRSAPRSRP